MVAYFIAFSWFVMWLFLKHRHRTFLVSTSLLAFLVLKFEVGYDWRSYYRITRDFYATNGGAFAELLGEVEILPLLMLISTPIPELSYFLFQVFTYALFLYSIYKFSSLFDVDANTVVIFYFLFLFYAIFSVLPQLQSNAFFILALYFQFTGRRNLFYGFLLLAATAHLSIIPFALFAIFFTSRSMSERMLMIASAMVLMFFLFDTIVDTYLARVIRYMLQIDQEKTLTYAANWLFILATYIAALFGLRKGKIQIDEDIRAFLGKILVLCLALHLIFVMSNTMHNRVFYIGFLMALPVLMGRQFAFRMSIRYLVFIPASVFLIVMFFRGTQSVPFVPYQTYMEAAMHGPNYGDGSNRVQRYYDNIARKHR